ncbi:multisubunit potassium/proton antiporter, PhaE subunit [Gemmobacter megaterium]|uniref:Multisubunit potassium/proton antiporter, PhaE subunit n=1 Tax=Gemmobacter megaterium TaxID=1086013 RepID=A0A1N7PDG9_9RHOB|nr:Na+/H+ antiporter subunit E [Gemmobacter megaterium]GGE18945.1 Na+/H+ antiporter subunit E [Gemmobacter megaterium]SIT08614.1 multisubunit potassium/proton antiporter, PhaE subunit [Gemmobacter megaterium]
MLRKLFPHPWLTLTLVLVWVALANTISLGGIVMGLILGIVIPAITAAYWPDSPRIRAPLKIVEFVLIVLWDIVKSNFIVARIVLFMPRDKLRPAWIVVPLDLRQPEAITVLAGTITMTPGTVSADVSADGRSLLVHCLHAPDSAGVVADIKARYESRLKEIFA